MYVIKHSGEFVSDNGTTKDLIFAKQFSTHEEALKEAKLVAAEFDAVEYCIGFDYTKDLDRVWYGVEE